MFWDAIETWCCNMSTSLKVDLLFVSIKMLFILSDFILINLTYTNVFSVQLYENDSF